MNTAFRKKTQLYFLNRTMKMIVSSAVLIASLGTTALTAAAEPEKLEPRAEVQFLGGNERTILHSSLWTPFREDTGSIWFSDVRLSGDWDDNLEANIGLGYRQYAMEDAILGGIAWIDRRKTERGSWFNQIALTGEYLQEDKDLRTNLYLPLSSGDSYVTPVIGSTTPYLADTGVYYNTNGRLVEKPLHGIDVEAGFRLPVFEEKLDSVRVYGAGYAFGANDVKPVIGGRLRARVDITPDLSVGARYQYDGARGAQSFAEVTLRWPFTNKKSFRSEGLRARMDESAERDIDIVSAAKVIDTGLKKPVTNTESGQQQRVVHVNNTGGIGDGSLENPYGSLADAQAAMLDNDIIYIRDNGGATLDGGLIINRENVAVIGSGIDFVFDSSRFGASLFALDGQVLAAATADAPVITNSTAWTADDLNGNGILVTASRAEISGLHIDDTGGNGLLILSNISGNTLENIDVHDMEVTNSTRRGIFANAINGGTIENISFEDNSTSDSAVRNIEIFASGGISTIEGVAIRRNTVTSTVGSVHNIIVQASGTGTVIRDVTIEDNTVTSTVGSTNGIVYIARGGIIEQSVIQGNTINGGTRGLSLTADTGSSVIRDLIVQNNDIQDAGRDGIAAVTAAQGGFENLLIRNNTIMGSGASGGTSYYGVLVNHDGTGVMDVIMTNNNIYNSVYREVFVDLIPGAGAGVGGTLNAQGNYWGGGDLAPGRYTLDGSSQIDTSGYLATPYTP